MVVKVEEFGVPAGLLGHLGLDAQCQAPDPGGGLCRCVVGCQVVRHEVDVVTCGGEVELLDRQFDLRDVDVNLPFRVWTACRTPRMIQVSAGVVTSASCRGKFGRSTW